MRPYRKRRTHLGPSRRSNDTRPEAVDIDAAALDPTRFYQQPSDVLADERLDQAEKRRILESWALDAERLSESEAENMTGRATERPFLQEAKLALLELDR
ncbi:MAG TPA: hypothetical protein VML92_01800 [Steroidobacteraceae bacterium]|nr:hypothetical protein [Steroidobacteraceae bacterium]